MNLLFRLFDIDDDGFISDTELRAMLERLGNEISDDDLSNMMKAADKDGDGQISYEEFVGMMRGLADDYNGLQAFEIFRCAEPTTDKYTDEMREPESPQNSKLVEETPVGDPSNRPIKHRRKSVLSIFSRSKKKSTASDKKLLPRASCPDLTKSIAPSSTFLSRRVSSQRTKSSPKFSESRPGTKWNSLRN